MNKRKKERATAETRHRREQAFASVLEVCPYIDTVQLALRRPLSSQVQAQLYKSGIGSLRQVRSKQWDRPFVMRIHQPSDDALRLATELVEDHVVNRVDLAFDLTMTCLDEARKLQDFLCAHLTQRWHGRTHVLAHLATLYFRPAWRRRNIVLYAEESSRHNEDPTLHLELRFYGAAACRRIGVHTTGDVRRVQPFAVAGREWRLSVIDTEKVQNRINKMTDDYLARHGRTQASKLEWPSRAHGRILAVITHATQDERGPVDDDHLGDIPAQALIDAFPRLTRRATTHIPVF